MSIRISGFFLVLFFTSIFFGMDKIIVKTFTDNGATSIEKWKIKHSLVLELLYAHQKKTTPNTKYLVIPRAVLLIDSIKQKHMISFSELLDNHTDKAKKNYFIALSAKKKRECIRSMAVIGATAQLAKLVDFFFPSEITQLIVPSIIEGQLENYIIKRAIKKNDGYERVKIDDGSYFSMASTLSSFYKSIGFTDAINCLQVITYCGEDQRIVVCMGNCVAVWQSLLEKSCKRLKQIKICDKECVINSVVLYEKTGKIVVGRNDGKLHIVDIENGKETPPLEGHRNSPIIGLSSNGPDGIIVSSTNDITYNLIVWDGENGDCLARLIGHAGINKAQVSYNGQFVVSQSPRETCMWKMYSDDLCDEINSIKKKFTCSQAQILYSLCSATKNKTLVSEYKKKMLDDQVKIFLEKYML